jgi:FtsH-binding integral membrane protein
MPVQPYSHRSGANPTNLFIIRASFLTAVLIFGAITYYIHSQSPPTSTVDPQTLTWIVLGLWGVITASLVVLSRRVRQPAPYARRATLSIVGWALGEMAALLGGLHYFLTGSPDRYGVGLLIFVIALVMFPIPRDEGPRVVR